MSWEQGILDQVAAMRGDLAEVRRMLADTQGELRRTRAVAGHLGNHIRALVEALDRSDRIARGVGPRMPDLGREEEG